MPEQKHIDDFFREQMAGHSEAPPPAAWKTLEQKLDSAATPGSVVSYYKWLRYGIIIGVVVLLVFMGRKVMNTQDLKPNTEKQMAVNSGQPGAEEVANGNAVAGNNQDQATGNTGANNQSTNNTSNTEAPANNDQATGQASLSGQNAVQGTTAAASNKQSDRATAPGAQAGNANNIAPTNNTNNRTTPAANLYKNNTGDRQHANTQAANINANAGTHDNGTTQNMPAHQAVNNNGQHAVMDTHSVTATANRHSGQAQVPNTAASVNARHNNQYAANAEHGNATANNQHNSHVAQATVANHGQRNGNNTNDQLHTPAPINHNKGNNANAALLSSRLKKGNIAAYPGKTTKMEYTQNGLKTVRDGQPTAAAGKAQSHMGVGNADVQGSGNNKQATAAKGAGKGNPFRIPDDNNNVASANIGSVDNKGVLPNEAANNNANTGGNKQATASATGGNNTNTNGASNPANAATANTNTNVAAANGAMHLNETNIASDRYNAAAAANWNAKQPGELSSLADNHNNIAAPKTEMRRMARALLIESGIKIGYEMGFQHFAANKYVIAPYIEYSKGRFGLSIQPTFKWARMNHTSNLGSTDVYYNVTNQPRLVNEVDSVFAQTLTKSRTLYYEEAHDSIVVRHHIATKSYTELEVPLLLNFSPTKDLKIFGGVLMDYTSIVQIQEDKEVNSYTRDAVVRQEYSTLTTEPALPDVNGVYQYKGTAYALYSTKGYDNVSSSKLTFGYMLGVNYTIRDKYLIDVSVLQNLSNMNYIPNEKVRGVYTQPYVRISAGYKFLQGKNKKNKNNRRNR